MTRHIERPLTKLDIVLPEHGAQGWERQVLDFHVAIQSWAGFGEQIDVAIQGNSALSAK